MFGKKKRQRNDVAEVTKAGVAPTAELSDDKLEDVAGGGWYGQPSTWFCPDCGAAHPNTSNAVRKCSCGWSELPEKKSSDRWWEQH